MLREIFAAVSACTEVSLRTVLDGLRTSMPPRIPQQHPKLQSPPRQSRAFVPGALQGGPGGPGRLSVGGVPLRGSDSGARAAGQEARGLGLVELPRACGSDAST